MVVSKRIAFATWSGEPALGADDRLAAAALEHNGHLVVPVPWDDARAPWSSFDAVVLRTTWNYHLALGAFSHWLEQLRERRVPLFNTVDLVRWNAEKGYLFELQRSGVQIPPTTLVRRGHAPQLERLLAERRWRAAVIKPAISANAHKTILTTPRTARDQQGAFAALAAGGDVLVQQLVDEIHDAGELSLVFFDGAFSHAVSRRPQPGDFRVQERYGGVTLPTRVTLAQIAHCASILRHVGGVPVYARVDGVVTKTGWVLMELELIEPSLFLSHDPESPGRFANALLRRIG